MSFPRGCGFNNNTKRLKALLVAGALFCGPMFAQADARQEPMRITPNEAVELAVRNNLGLESARVSASVARRAADLAWNPFIPAIDVGGSLVRPNIAPSLGPMADLMNMLSAIMPPGTPMQPMADPPRWMLMGSLSATLNFNVAMFEEMRRLRLDYERGLISYANARTQLERDIRKAYHNILLLQENIALLHVSLENLDRQVQIAQANFNAGLAPELTLLQAQVARENFRPIIDQAEGGLILSMMQFAMFLGLPHDTVFELEPVATDLSPIILNTSELISRAAAGQPDVQVLRQDILIMDSIRQSSRHRLFTPTLSLAWNADPTFGGDPWRNNWFDSDRWSWSQSGLFRFTVGFRLNGLLPFGAERQGIRALEDQIRIANIGLAQMIRGTEIEIHNLVLTLERIKLSMGALEQTVILAERSFQLTEQAYQAGFVDLFQVHNAEQSLRQARVQLHEQQFNYLNSLIDLEFALGVPFGTLTSTGN